MHNLHFILVNAETAKDAASTVETEIAHWGTDNNWHSIGGIASEDGKDDIENHDSAAWALSFLDDEDTIPKEGTYFSRAVAYLHSVINAPITLRFPPYSEHADMESALEAVSEGIKSFDSSKDNPYILWAMAQSLKLMSGQLESQTHLKAGKPIPSLHEWQLTEMGLTDLTDPSSDEKRYIVFLDMHS